MFPVFLVVAGGLRPSLGWRGFGASSPPLVFPRLLVQVVFAPVLIDGVSPGFKIKIKKIKKNKCFHKMLE